MFYTKKVILVWYAFNKIHNNNTISVSFIASICRTNEKNYIFLDVWMATIGFRMILILHSWKWKKTNTHCGHLPNKEETEDIRMLSVLKDNKKQIKSFCTTYPVGSQYIDLPGWLMSLPRSGQHFQLCRWIWGRFNFGWLSSLCC